MWKAYSDELWEGSSMHPSVMIAIILNGIRQRKFENPISIALASQTNFLVVKS